jgi:autotransporter-associated beta strand protein
LGAYNADLIVSGSIGDNGNNYDLLIRSASGNLTDTVTLSGANTYGGRTIIYQGAVKLDGGDNRLPLGTILQLGFYGTGNLLMGQLDLNGRNQELAGLEVNANMPDTQPTLRAQQIVKNDSGTAAMLTLNNSADYNFAGRLVGNLGLTKKGSGMFTLSSTNTYSGVTAVSNGTLRLTRSDCLSTNAPISIDTSASAKLDLAFTGTQTVSTLSVDGKVLFRNFIYNAANLPAALSGTGNLRTTEGPILGAMVQFF